MVSVYDDDDDPGRHKGDRVDVEKDSCICMITFCKMQCRQLRVVQMD